MFLCLIKFISKYSEGQGRQNQARAGPDRPMDSLNTKYIKKEKNSNLGRERHCQRFLKQFCSQNPLPLYFVNRCPCI